MLCLVLEPITAGWQALTIPLSNGNVFCWHCHKTSHSTTPHPMNRARRRYTVFFKKAQMECLGFEPGASEWQAQTKPQSNGGHLGGILLSIGGTLWLLYSIIYVVALQLFILNWVRTDHLFLKPNSCVSCIKL